ncbi:MAG: hypothetical protein V1838_01280 [Patescibacteria group bacterium]
MPLYKITDSKLNPLEAKSFKLEIDLQRLIDNNLKDLFGIDFIKSEFGGQGLSIDTIAYDPETKAPVLIEYKRDKQDTVIDQGMAYLRWLLEHKGDYRIELLEKLGKKDIDWSQSRVIFIARSFNKFHIQAAGYKDLPLELWEYDWYENYLYINRIDVAKSDASITSLVKTKEAKEISKEIKSFSVEDHLGNKPKKIKELFELFNEGMKSIAPDFDLHPVKSYVGYYKGGYNLIELIFQTNQIILNLLRVKPGELKDPESEMKYINKSIEYYNKAVSNIHIKNDDDVAYALMLVKRLLDKFKGKVGNW